MDDKIKKLKEIIEDSNNIVFFGGAGCSCESGIPDFRSANGLFNEKLNITFTPEQLVSHSFFERYPEEFFNFYKAKLVYPAAGLINYFRGKNLVLINKSSTQADSKANLVINDSIGKVLKEVID